MLFYKYYNYVWTVDTVWTNNLKYNLEYSIYELKYQYQIILK